MKPIQLKLKGINSYRKEQIIDFETLTSQGFFGIFGPTGSGKSTILDAITLALYARLPRSTKNFINTHEKSASVSFTFSITTSKVTHYLVERSFRYHNPDKNPTVRNISGRLLDITVEDNPIVLADRPTDVTEECKNILGLSSDDFMRTVVLPQGQFSDFLKLKNADRRSMLQRIFHLEKYGVELSGKIQRARQKHELVLSELEGERKIYEAVTPSLLKDTRKEHKESLSSLVLIQKEKDEAKERFLSANQTLELQQEFEPIKNSYEKLTASLPELKVQEERLTLQKKANQIQPFDKQLSKRKLEASQALAKHTELEKLSIKMQKDYEEAQKASFDAERQYNEKYPVYMEQEHQITTASDITSAIKEQRSKLLNSKKEYTDTLPKLEAFKSKEAHLIEKEKKLRDSLQLLETKQKTLSETLQNKATIEEGCMLENTYREKRNQHLTKKNNLESVKNTLVSLEKEKAAILDQLNQCQHEGTLLYHRSSLHIKKLNTLLVDLNEKQLQLDHVREQKKQNDAIRELQSQLADGIPCPVCGCIHHANEETPLPSEIQTTDRDDLMDDAQYTTSMKTYSDQETHIRTLLQNQEQQRAILALNLEQLSNISDSDISDSNISDSDFDNSDITGYDFDDSDFDDSNSELIDLEVMDSPDILDSPLEKERVSLFQKNLQNIVAQYSTCDGKIQQTQKQLSLESEQLSTGYKLLQDESKRIIALRDKAGITSFTETLSLLREKEKELEKISSKIKKIRTDIDTATTQLQAIRQDIFQTTNRLTLLEHTLTQGEIFIKEQAARYPLGFDEDSDFKLLKIQLAQKKNTIETQRTQTLERFQKLSKTLQNLREELSAAANEKSRTEKMQTEALETFQNQLSLMNFDSDINLKELYLPLEEITKRSQKIEDFYTLLNETTEKYKYLKEKQPKHQITQEEWDTYKRSYEETEENYEHLQKEAALLEHRITLLKEQLKEKKRLEDTWKEAIHKKSMIHELELLFKGNAFVEYVAASRLKYIAREASAILSSISNGNYELEVNDATEFVIKDNKNGGVLRPSDTLSGGETFITSLALALSLSSVIQLGGTAPLELFFLDEGFGSLDEDLIDVVMTSLEKLQNKKRSIGIISHVEAIEARVPVKLKVTSSDIDQNGSNVTLEYS